MADLIPYEIPLTPTPQSFGVALNQISCRMLVYWVAALGGGWVLDIAAADGTPIVNGIPLVTGANLIDGFQYLGLSGTLVVQTDHDTDALPTFDNLGVTSHLFFLAS